MDTPMDLTSYVAQTHTATDDTALWETLKSFLSPYGFDSLIFCLMSDHRSIGENAKHGIITGYPEDWMKHYNASNYEPIDPIRKESVLTPQNIFTWEGVDVIRPYNKKERSILSQAGDAGLKSGVAVSLCNPHMEHIAMGFASSTGGVEFTPIMLSVLKLASIQFYDMYQELHRKPTPVAMERVSLSDREREVLQWAAVGKSNPDIATILNISDSTVAYFLQRCFAKLDANSKTLAVVKALRLGLISLDPNLFVFTQKQHS
jgi:DNA-binding CsgD family transcriptional regulator